MAIEKDDRAGKYPTYEHLSARLDEAAREREAECDFDHRRQIASICETVMWCVLDMESAMARCVECGARAASPEVLQKLRAAVLAAT